MDNGVMPILPVDSCAAGYRFYQCSDGGFSGCCSTDPCSLKICPVENSPSSMAQTATSPSTTLVTSTISAKSSIVTTTTATTTTTTTTASVSTFQSSSTYLAPLTATATATGSSLFGTDSSGSRPSSSSRVSTSGAIIGGVVGGVLILISLLTAILFWSRMRRRSTVTKVKHGHEKWVANDEFSSSGHGGYGDSIFDSYLSNGENKNPGTGRVADHTNYYETLSSMRGGINTNTNTAIPNKLKQQQPPSSPSPCVFAEPPPRTRIVESSSCGSTTRYFHIPTSSSPRFFTYVDNDSSSSPSLLLLNSCSAQTDFSDDSSEQISDAGGVAIPRSARSVSHEQTMYAN